MRNEALVGRIVETRRCLCKQICDLVNEAPLISITEICSAKHGRKTNCRKGLYFLYDATGVVLYVGVIRDRPITSLYDRLIGHGPKGAHKYQWWYRFVTHARFRRFGGMTDTLLLEIERLAIIENMNPIFNDKDQDRSLQKCIQEALTDCAKQMN